MMSAKSLLTMVFFAAVIGYVAYQLTGLVRRPKLVILEPSDGATVNTELLTIRGQAKELTKVLINGEKLDLKEDGAFETKLLLAPGYNIITAAGEDRFGRTSQKTLRLVYDQKN